MEVSRGKADVIFGMQAGDEGKGRFIDEIVDGYSSVVRYNGGPNAGHTVVVNDYEINLHQVPSGILHGGVVNICGNGMVIDPIKLGKEISDLKAAGVEVTPENLKVSADAVVILPQHIYRDRLREAGHNGQGSTASGIAYAYGDKYIRMGNYARYLKDDPEKLIQLIEEGVEEYNPLLPTKNGTLYDREPQRVARVWERQLQRSGVGAYIADTFSLVRTTLKEGKNILAEGSQGVMLDIEYGGKPGVTSSDIGVTGAQKGAPLKHTDIGSVYGVYKFLPSRVGRGVFVSDIEKIHGPEIAAEARGNRGEPDAEYGKTTGRERRVGYLDLPVLRLAASMNQIDEMFGTKLDVLRRLRKFGRLPIVTAYIGDSGERLDIAPSHQDELAACLPVIEYVDLSDKPVGDIRKIKDLPREDRYLIDFVDSEVGVNTTMVGVGYNRDQIATKE